METTHACFYLWRNTLLSGYHFKQSYWRTLIAIAIGNQSQAIESKLNDIQNSASVVPD